MLFFLDKSRLSSHNTLEKSDDGDSNLAVRLQREPGGWKPVGRARMKITPELPL